MTGKEGATPKRQWYSDLPEESFIPLLTKRQTENGKYDWRSAEHPFEGLGELFHLVLAGITVAVVIISTMIFALMDAEWTLWHWVTMGVLGGLPGFLTVAGLVILVFEHIKQYGRYKDMLAHAESKGWKL